MASIKQHLGSVVRGLSVQNYERSLASYRFWFDIGLTYSQITPDQTFNDILGSISSEAVSLEGDKLFHPAAHLIIRFAGDVESDNALAPPTAGLQSRLCAHILQGFFESNLSCASYEEWSPQTQLKNSFVSTANLIASWANLGYVEESAIRNHILQSLVSDLLLKLYDFQACAVIVLFKIAGAAFEAYADPSAVDRCFELLKNHYSCNTVKGRLVQVRVAHTVECGNRIDENLKELLELREHGWEGLPPPPVFATRIPKATGTSPEDPSATPVATSLGLPDRDLEPQIPHSPPLESVAITETETTPSPPPAQSPSISISTLSDFEAADIFDEESPADPTTVTPHDTFYLEDGNVEVLCGNTLFRVHISVLSFRSPTLRQTLSQASLATTESPNGYPRILSSEKAADFATLLKMIYLPEFYEQNKVPDFNTFSSLLRITEKYEMSAVRSRLLDVVRDAYPETFEGITPTKLLGEKVFSGPTPHPNEVLNLFIQQKLTSALPMAYYMAVRRGVNSLMDRHLPRGATLSPGVLQSAIEGLIALREVELNETHLLVFGQKGSQPCSESKCPSRVPTGPAAVAAYQRVFDHVVGSSQRGTKVLQVPQFRVDREGDDVRVIPDVCANCLRRWESGHAELRKKVWGMLPNAFGLAN